MMRHARGQALLETAIFVPVLLLAIASVFWMGQSQVIADRVQQAVRNAGVMQVAEQTTLAQSLNSLYAALEQGPGKAPACVAPNTALYTAQTVSLPDGSQVRQSPFFLPKTGVTSSCSGNLVYALRGHGLTRDLLLYANYEQASADVPSALSGFTALFGPNSPITNARVTIGSTVYQSPPLSIILKAYPELFKPLKATLITGFNKPQNDPTGVFQPPGGSWNADPPTDPPVIGSAIPDMPGSFTPAMPGPPPPLPPAPPGQGVEGSGEQGGGQSGGNLHG